MASRWIADSLPKEMEVTHINLNDGTVEGMRHRELPIFSVQYHPEAAPGRTTPAIFSQFADLIDAQSEVAHFFWGLQLSMFDAVQW